MRGAVPRHVSLHSWLLRAHVWDFSGPRPSSMLCTSICSPQFVMETSKTLNPQQPLLNPGARWGKKETHKHKLWFTQHINVINVISCKQTQKKKEKEYEAGSLNRACSNSGPKETRLHKNQALVWLRFSPLRLLRWLLRSLTRSRAAPQSEVKYCSVASPACECFVIELPGRATL